MDNSKEMVEVFNVRKIYNNNRGVEKVSFRAKSGEVISIIGPNGSGKSTVLNIISGRIESDGGGAFINGDNTFSMGAKKRIGYLPDDFRIYDKMTIYDLLTFIGNNKYKEDLTEEIEYYLKDLDMWDRKDEYIYNLSLGMKSKVAIVVSFLGAPELIVMDEPTNALDAKGIILLKKYIALLKKYGSTIVISSNVLDFVKDISTRIVFLKDGKVIKDIMCNKKINLDKIYSELYF